MSSSSSGEEEEDFVFYRDREEWKDVIPLAQDDGPFPVVSIAYTEKFSDVYDYLRAVLKLNEQSERVFQLVTDAVTLNAANYTVWHFRRILLKALQKDLQKELIYITGVIRSQPKNYQVWYHRGIIVQWMNDASEELTFTQEMLKRDAKNYHCWQHRQLVLNHFKSWDGEVEYTSSLIQEDLRNNSAWNQRYYAVVNTTGFTTDVVEKELGYTLDSVKMAPNNESSWNYLKGILRSAGGLAKYTFIKDDLEKMLSEGVDSPYLLSFLVDYYEEELETDASKVASAQRAVELCDLLAKDVDTIRREYWEYIRRTLTSRFLV